MYIDKNFSIKDLFEKMSISKKNYILKEDVIFIMKQIERYLKSNRIYYNEKDLLLVFKNLDMNQDGKVSYSEVINFYKYSSQINLFLYIKLIYLFLYFLQHERI